ncbi:uncharacterized protein ZBIST_1456 [Zygosaccharomyces bailii]|nr:uncharacterized protein ZBIST_1456 [Zygosaccharomyces bailii]
MDAVGTGDMFDLFDLDNENDIDFETAYKMISNFDDATSSLNDDILPKLGFGNMEKVDAAQFALNQTDQHELPDLQRQHQEHWHHNEPLEGVLKDIQTDHSTSASEPDNRPQLLSVYESNAIEQFLDSLVSRNNVTEWEEGAIREKEPSNSEDYSYHPPPVEIPEITLTDSDIPGEIRNNPRMVKKWKHVEIERIRRNQIKKTFDQLIGMTRYPRGHGKTVGKPHGDKRIPKHTLLNFIVEDIRLILQANQRLELLLRGSNGKENNVGV